MSFPKATLALLDRSKEVDIETRSPGPLPHQGPLPLGTKHSVPIWIVVDGDDVFIRAVRGPTSRWYRELVAGPGALVADGKRIKVRAIRAADAASVKRASDGYRKKYRKGGSLDSMLLTPTLPTTLRLEPA